MEADDKGLHAPNYGNGTSGCLKAAARGTDPPGTAALPVALHQTNGADFCTCLEMVPTGAVAVSGSGRGRGGDGPGRISCHDLPIGAGFRKLIIGGR